MKVLVCIDDTDNLESKGTGAISNEIRQMIENNNWGECSFITRHQLFLHDDIPYTSHNSSMCFEANIYKEHFEKFVENATIYLRNESADGSDPGICVAVVDKIVDKDSLIEFGLRAKRSILTKEEAYELADGMGLYLSEQGGTGEGIIGALAGIGLRLSKDDGELKGGIPELNKEKEYKVSEILKLKNIDKVSSIDMRDLSDNEVIKIVWKAKPILNKGELVLFVKKNEKTGENLTLTKNEIRKIGDKKTLEIVCKNYKPDVEEEKVVEKERTCLNCRYRKWTNESFECLYY